MLRWGCRPVALGTVCCAPILPTAPVACPEDGGPQLPAARSRKELALVPFTPSFKGDFLSSSRVPSPAGDSIWDTAVTIVDKCACICGTFLLGREAGRETEHDR